MKPGAIEDIYPLSPMQRGMLFQSIYEIGSSVYSQQISAVLRGDLDGAAFVRTWETIIGRHAVLRTAFEWEELDEPMQVVCRNVDLPLTQEDWRDLPAADQQRLFDELLGRELRGGFDFSKPPLMRLRLIQVDGEVHYFIWTFHHILLDGWCSSAVLKEVFTLYDAFKFGEDVRLENPRPYRDFIAWLLKQDSSRAEAHWRRVLCGVRNVAEAPSDRDASGEGYALEALRLPESLSAALVALARRERVTPNTVIQAAWAVLLSRYSAEEDIVVGSVVSGRPADLPGVESMVGLFINTVPVRARISTGKKLSSLLQDLHQGQVESREFEYSPLVEIKRWSEAPAGQPLFESLLIFQNYPVDEGLGVRILQGRGVEVCEVRFSGQTATYPLTLVAGIGAFGLSLRLEYDRSRFLAPTAFRMLGHLTALLEAFPEMAGQPVNDLPIIDGAERHQLLREWNDTAVAFAEQNICLHELFEAQANRTPDAVAISFEDQEITYCELSWQSNRLARCLGRLGVRPEATVGLLMERSAEMLVAVVGILKAGGVYLPLGTDYPPERLDLVLRDSAPVALVTDGRPLSGVAADVPHIELRRDCQVLIAEKESRPILGRVPEESLAYVIYTSGSTGQPKGVMISHRSIVNRLLWMELLFPLSSGDSVLQKTSATFDASLWEIFVPLLSGAKVVMARPEGHRDAAYLLHVAAERQITILQLVPSMLRVFLEEEDIEELRSLRRMFCGGEALSMPLMERFFARSSAQLCNLYGPTESSIDATFQLCETGMQVVAIGRPVANLHVYLLDFCGHPAPVGVPGEIYLGGVGLARGYLGRPDLTAERFVPNAFGATPGERLYATGDLARRLANGTIEYLGRVDQQIKVRGFRIEPGEIESVLTRYPGVDEVAVVPCGSDAERRLIAYVAHGRRLSPDVGELRHFLRQQLPEYMVPSAFVFLESLPRTSSGKVNRQALPELDRQAMVMEGAIAPRSPLEEVLVEVWCDVLGLDQLGVHDDFFQLGGHSLSATQVTSRLRRIFGFEMQLREVFEFPTVARLASWVEISLKRKEALEPPPLELVPRDAELPLSFSQQRLWFLDQLEPGSLAYTIALGVRFIGPLNVAVLAGALAEVVRRHEVLRTTFPAVDGRPVQRISPGAPVMLPMADLTELPAPQRLAELNRLQEWEAEIPFVLAHGPLLRLTVLRLDKLEHVLLLSLHHIIADGWSLTLLVREVVLLYQAFSAGRSSPLPELPIQYADYAYWQRRWLQGEVLEKQLAYWRQQLAGLPPVLDLQLDRVRPAVQTRNGSSLPIKLSRDVSQALRRIGRSEGCTLFMTLLAGLQALMRRYSGQDDFAIGTPVAGRTRFETEGLVGLLLNALVLRSDCAGDPTFRELLGRVREVSLGAFAHQDLPFELIVEALQPERSLSYSPLYQVMLIFQNVPQAVPELPGLRIGILNREHKKSNLDLTLNLGEAQGEIRGSIEYSTDLFDRLSIARLLKHFETLLRGAVADPGRHLSELPLLTTAERQEVLASWNQSERRFPLEHSFIDLFTVQARRTRDRVAVACDGEQLSYDWLESQSSRLARRLIDSEVAPERVVAVLAPRSVPFLVTVLAIWKAGGVYLPLDPLHPGKRLARVLSSSGTCMLLVAEALTAVAREALAQLPLEHRPSLLTLEELMAQPGTICSASPSLGPQQLAYVIYTSGSTGTPKGAMVEHRGMLNHLYAKVTDLGIGADDVIAQTASQAFDISVWQFLAALLVGGRVEIVRDETAHDPHSLLNALSTAGISLLETVPSLMGFLVEEVEKRGAPARYSAPALRWLVPTGEALPPKLCRDWLRPHPEIPLLNAYGPTECSDDVTHYPIFSAPPVEIVRVPIGQPVANMAVYVVDRLLEPLPVGLAGELVVGGVGVGRGYLGDPPRTAEVFVPDPFGAAAGSRLYRTGDLARRLTDGNLEFLRRLDYQVKLRGFRIELEEIEAALSEHPAVRNCAVLARASDPRGAHLVAFVEADQIGSGELKVFLKERLPDYMIPTSIAFLEALPLSSNGKLDRRALAEAEPQSDVRSPALSSADEAPRDPIEELLAGVWCDLLGAERVGRHDNFFELGGHSLIATRVVSRLRNAFQVELPLRIVFESPTLAELADRVRSLHRATGPILPPIQRARRDRPLPLSFAQQRLWFLHQLDPDQSFYNLPVAVRINGLLNSEALVHALSEILRRHEVLRTSFAVVDGSPVQVIRPACPMSLPLIDLSALPAQKIEAELRRLSALEAFRPFDLSRPPMLRGQLLRVSEGEHVGLFTVHHIASDDWSLGLLVHELVVLYQAYLAGAASPLSELPLQYADYASWQREWLQGEILESHLAYWRRQLSGNLPHLSLPTDRPRSGVPTYLGRQVNFAFPPALARDIQELSRREGATLFMTLLAGFKALLHRYTGQEDLIVGTAIAGRERSEAEGLIGCFINMLALRTRISPSMSFRELLHQVREVALEAYAHQQVPFEKVVEELQPDRVVADSPIFQVAFGVRNAPLEVHELPGVTMRVQPHDGDRVRFDLTLWMTEAPNGLLATWRYRSDFFEATTIARMHNHLQTLLERAIAQPDTECELLDIYSEAEKKQRAQDAAVARQSRYEKFKSFQRNPVLSGGGELQVGRPLEPESKQREGL